MTWQGTDPSAWAERTKKLMTALLRNSVQTLAQEASRTRREGGNVPVFSGNLARSVVVSNTPPDADAPDVEYEVQRDISGGLADIEPGEPVYIGWTPIYAARVNYGFVGTDSLGRQYNQAGAGFAEATAAKWPAIVAGEVAKLTGRSTV